MQLDKALTDRKAQSGSTVAPAQRAIGLLELLKGTGQLLRRHANACIGYTDVDDVVLAARTDGDGAVLGKAPSV